MNTIHLRNETAQAVAGAPLRRAVRATLRAHGATARPAGLITILLTQDARLRALNRQFRGVDRVTDILSFPAPPHGIAEEAPALGDLVVALPMTTRRALQAGRPPTDDLMLLMVHGTLHLLGYTHETESTYTAMWAVQTALLRQLGLPPDLASRLQQDALVNGTH